MPSRLFHDETDRAKCPVPIRRGGRSQATRVITTSGSRIAESDAHGGARRLFGRAVSPLDRNHLRRSAEQDTALMEACVLRRDHEPVTCGILRYRVAVRGLEAPPLDAHDQGLLSEGFQGDETFVLGAPRIRGGGRPGSRRHSPPDAPTTPAARPPAARAIVPHRLQLQRDAPVDPQPQALLRKGGRMTQWHSRSSPARSFADSLARRPGGRRQS
jgi:hypothetical protein